MKNLRAQTIRVALCVVAVTTAASGQVGKTSPESLLSFVRFRSIGPAGPGGRVDDIAVSKTDPSLIYIAYATGGIFKSVNNGTTFEPVFESYTTASFGSLAIAPTNSNIVYAGSGEANNRNTSSFGDGIYKTVDGGKTWANVGLKETQTISRVVVDPHNADIVYVAANGHLFGPNPERGIYKTVDGGKTWILAKFIDENTGFTDLSMDPSNANVLYAASYQRRRSGCCYNGGGPGSGLWKTTDAGKTWMRLSGGGLPTGTYGRIALDVSAANPRVVYAQIEVGEVGNDSTTVTAGEGAGAPTGRGGFEPCNNGSPLATEGRGRGGSRADSPPPLNPKRSGVYRSSDAGKTWTLMSNCDERPLYFSQLRADPSNADVVYVGGSPTSISKDGGKTFTALSRAGGNAEPSHVDIHAIWVDPRNSKHLMIGTDGGLNVTWDQGKSWNPVVTMAAGLSYWVSADLRRPYYVFTGMQDNGVWGGPSGTRAVEGVIPNSAWFGISPGDGFKNAVDPTDFHVVYAESQNGTASRYDLRTGAQQSIHPVAGGVSPREPRANGTCVDGRVGGRGGGGRGGAGQRANVLNAEPGEQYRFNWNTPYELSPNDPNILWFGGNRLFKSYNRGDTYVESADLTKNIDRCKVNLMGARGDKSQLGKNDGVTSYSTIISIAESPVTAGVVWAGTDDGNVQISKDGGATFTEVGKNLPGLPAGALTSDNPYWISRIETSHFDAATTYVAVDGHRSDDLRPYVFVTHDFGRTFQSINGNLPASGDVQVIREDPRSKNVLYVGTEFGLFVSLDAGKTWSRMHGGFPTVRTDDILVHPRDGDLIVATHGRGVWIADDITPLHQLDSVASSPSYLFDVRPPVAYQRDLQLDRCRPTLPCFGQSLFLAENAPAGTAISYYLGEGAPAQVTLTVSDASGRPVCRSDAPGGAGLHRVQWTLAIPLLAPVGGGGRGNAAPSSPSCSTSGEAASASPGEYTIKLTVSGHDLTKQVHVLEDRWLNER